MNDGAVLSYSKVGHGQPVILIHGFGGYRQIWTRQVPFLVSQGYQVVMTIADTEHRPGNPNQRV